MLKVFSPIGKNDLVKTNDLGHRHVVVEPLVLCDESSLLPDQQALFFIFVAEDTPGS